MRLILVDLQLKLCQAFEEYFDGLPDVEVVNGRFENLPEYDCMVSAANSFGLMDGGVDGAITAYFGQQLMDRVQKQILDEWHGEQPVGTSMIIETGHEKHPYIAHTPTMRYPMDIRHTDSVYRAMWAMLNTVSKFNKQTERKINIIACPGLGTDTGNMPFKEAARQMALAWKNFLNPPRNLDWDFAHSRLRDVRFGSYLSFNYPMDEDE